VTSGLGCSCSPASSKEGKKEGKGWMRHNGSGPSQRTLHTPHPTPTPHAPPTALLSLCSSILPCNNAALHVGVCVRVCVCGRRAAVEEVGCGFSWGSVRGRDLGLWLSFFFLAEQLSHEKAHPSSIPNPHLFLLSNQKTEPSTLAPRRLSLRQVPTRGRG
jgi:hypothetical protein